MQILGVPEREARESPASDIRTLLIVDDEDAVVYAIREALGDAKYRVITTTDPAQALQILETDDSVDLLITDLFMPAMDGGTLLKRPAASSRLERCSDHGRRLVRSVKALESTRRIHRSQTMAGR